MGIAPSQPETPAAAAGATILRAEGCWRLTIGQLLLWMATTGVVLAFIEATGRGAERV